MVFSRHRAQAMGTAKRKADALGGVGQLDPDHAVLVSADLLGKPPRVLRGRMDHAEQLRKQGDGALESDHRVT